MYRRDIPKLPTPISRDEFVELVFILGRENSHGYDTIVAAVQIGDHFISYSQPRIPYRKLTPTEKMQLKRKKRRFKQIFGIKILNLNVEAMLTKKMLNDRGPGTFMDELVPQIYSIELAHVVTVIAAKCNEDFYGYQSTRRAIEDTENCYVQKMEWEIFDILGFGFKVYNFISIIGLLLMEVHNTEQPPHLSSVFYDISKDICLSPELLAKNPWSIVLGVFLLGRAGKLRALRLHRERIFHETMKKVAHEYELDVAQLLRAYIKLKQSE